jgi:putative SOS response-associated peptidase YedK
VLATTFWEPSTRPDPATGKKVWAWFALDEERPLFAFAGIWRTWHGVRGTKANSIEGMHELFGFLTTEPNAMVRAMHQKAMPAILRTGEEIDLWMGAPIGEALALQKPLRDAGLMIVGKGRHESALFPRGAFISQF